jgi:thiol-disulfide isomerase/thioredoxin
MPKKVDLFRAKPLLSAWNHVKPWVIFFALLFILHYTGVLSGISILTGRALMETGVMDAHPEEPAVAKKFNYNFSIKDLGGNVIDVEQFKGKTIFLNIWATWCGPCRMEMPSIQNLYNQVDNGKILFIMLSVDRGEDINKVKSFVKEKEYTFPVYTPASTLPNQLQVGVIPSTFVISPEGKVVSSETGAAKYDTPEFRAFIENLVQTP